MKSMDYPTFDKMLIPAKMWRLNLTWDFGDHFVEYFLNWLQFINEDLEYTFMHISSVKTHESDMKLHTCASLQTVLGVKR